MTWGTDSVTMQIFRTTVVAGINLAILFIAAIAIAAPTRFGPGTQIVGRDVEPATYESGEIRNGSCRWERLKGFSGEIEDFIAGDVAMSGRAIVTIEPSDAGFTSQGCGAWQRVK